MIEVSTLQRSNLNEAIKMWLTIPKEQVSKDLASWRSADDSGPRDQPPTCNTIACFGGWCAWNPVFRAQGVRVTEFGEPYFEKIFSRTVCDVLFGVRDLFYFRGEHPVDDDSVSDWQIVMDRLEFLRFNSEVV